MVQLFCVSDQACTKPILRSSPLTATAWQPWGRFMRIRIGRPYKWPDITQQIESIAIIGHHETTAGVLRCKTAPLGFLYGTT